MLILFFLLGLAVGSFLNSIIYRLETEESIIKKRSYCPRCKKTLSWFELIPLMSFILQRGKCRHCKKPISLQYPLVELATGFLFVLCAWYFLPDLLFTVVCLLFISCLIIIFVYDLKHYIIPNEVVYSGIIVAFLYRLFGIFQPMADHSQGGNLDPFIVALLAGVFFFSIILISKGKWMGMGDMKLAVFMGLILGWPKILVALFLAFLIGAFASVILIILKKKTLKSEIPFGPFLAGAAVVALFLGDILVSWYLNLFI